MVQNSGKTLCPGAFKPVNWPETAEVEEDPAGRPTAVKARRQEAVIAIENRWRIDDEWWRSEPVTRCYYAVILSSGQRLVIYKDLARGGWFRQAY